MIASFIGVHDLSEEVRIHNNAALLLSLSPLSVSLCLSPSLPQEYQHISMNISLNAMKSESQSNIGYHHLRQGGYGNWRNIFTVKQNEIFDTVR
jgi:hypothetical protein